MVVPVSNYDSDIAKSNKNIDDFCINVSSRQYENLDVLSASLEGKSKHYENMN